MDLRHLATCALLSALACTEASPATDAGSALRDASPSIDAARPASDGGPSRDASSPDGGSDAPDGGPPVDAGPRRVPSFEDNYDLFPSAAEKHAFALLKMTLYYLDEDQNLAHEEALIDAFVDAHSLAPDFLEDGEWFTPPPAVREVMDLYYWYLDLQLRSPVYATDAMQAAVRSPTTINERVVMLNHLDRRMQPLVYNYLAAHDELDGSPRWLNIYPTYDWRNPDENGYALHDRRFSDEVVTHMQFSGAGAFNRPVLARHYDLMGYAFNDCVKTMAQTIVEDALASSSLSETTLLWHAGALYMNAEVLSGEFTPDDFLSHLQSHLGDGNLSFGAVSRDETATAVHYRVDATGTSPTATRFHFEMRADKP